VRPVLVDTAVVYALADKADQAHEAAKTLLARLLDARTPLLITVPTVYEAHRLILYRLGTRAGQRFLAVYSQIYNTVWLTETYHTQAVALLERFEDQRISVTDAANAVVARALGATVATFDHHYEMMGLPVVRR
jgi:predicted nucleic acid-binding protein